MARHLIRAVLIVLLAFCAHSRVEYGKGSVKLCPSPAGWHPCECLHEVDSHSRVDEIKNKDGSRKAVIHYPNGTTKTLEQCAHKGPFEPIKPGLVRQQLGTNAASTSKSGGHSDAEIEGPCQLGWAHATPMEAFYQHSRNITNFTAVYTVPEPPTIIGANVLYYWIGLQDFGAMENSVIQPVLSWEKDSSPNNWYFESWNCCPAGHKIKATSVPIKQGAGANLFGSMHRDSDGLFTIASEDAAGKSSVLYSNDTLSGISRTWNWVEIVLETYSVTSCSDYSAGGLAQFLNMTLVDVEGQAVTPVWTMNPYINGKYLNASAAAQFTACCNGSYDLSWPSAVMHQNAAVPPVVSSMV